MRKTLKLVSLSALILVASFLIKSSSASAAANGRIYYSAIDDEAKTYDIGSINPDGSDKTNLTQDGINYYYDVSPDGKSVLYTKVTDGTGLIHSMNRDGTNDQATAARGIPIGWISLNKFAYGNAETGDVYTINTDGSANIKTPSVIGLEGIIGFPAFSNNAKKMAYVKSVGDRFSIHISNLDGGQDTQLSDLEGSFSPVFTKNDTKIYFLGSTDGETVSLYSVNVDGSAQTLIHALPAGQPFFLKLSPDGQKLLYGIQGETGSFYDIYTMNLDGSNQQQIFDELGSLDDTNMFMNWSPDSTKLVLTKQTGEDPNTNNDIFTVDADGSNLTNITNTTDLDEVILYSFQPWAPVIDNTDGDFNNDGILDSRQTNVTSTTDTVSGDRVVLESSSGCTNEDLSVVPESSNATKDPTYDYPLGLMNFTLDCVQNGTTATITQYYYNQSKEGYVLRKYNTTTKTYADIPQASISETTVEGSKVLVVTYAITDGGPLDQDGTVNGKIVDPAGLAMANLAGTGQNTRVFIALSFALLATTTGLLMLNQRLSRALSRF